MDFIEPKDRLIEDLEQKLIFIPLFNYKKEFLEYTYTDLDNKEKVIHHIPFHLINNHGKKYTNSSVSYLSMHEIIIGQKAPPGFKIDHANSNGLDNRSINLRIATNGQNSHNKVKSEGKTSKYYGVFKASNEKKWTASITFKGEHYYLGAFENVLDAVKIHDIYAIFYYRECARLNLNDNGNYFVTEEEIKEIYLNGIPEKYKRSKRGEDKKGNLPPCIYYNNFNAWFYEKTYNYITYRKSYGTCEEAEEGLKELEKEIENMKNEEKIKKEENITRNKDGIAVLYTYNKDGEINGEWPVDDDVWKFFIHNNWSIGRDYAHAYVNGVIRDLHVHVYRQFVGEIPEGMTVDHIKSWDKKDTRLSNLRLASKSLQAHNTIRKKRSILRYKGISIRSGKFSLKYKNKNIGTYFYEEDAKLEYNRLATLDYGDDATLIEITDTKTTALDYFNNLTVEFLEGIETVYETKEVFRNRPNWMKKYSIKTSEINIDNYKNYINFAIKLLEGDIKNGENTECIDDTLNEKITLEYLKNIKTVRAIKEVFRIRHDWKTQYNVHFNKITTLTLPDYINLAIEAKNKEMVETKTHTLHKPSTEQNSDSTDSELDREVESPKIEIPKVEKLEVESKEIAKFEIHKVESKEIAKIEKAEVESKEIPKIVNKKITLKIINPEIEKKKVTLKIINPEVVKI